MPKVIIECDYYEEREEYQTMLDAISWRALVQELEQKLHQLQYADMPTKTLPVNTPNEAFAWAKQELYDLLDNRGLSLL